MKAVEFHHEEEEDQGLNHLSENSALENKIILSLYYASSCLVSFSIIFRFLEELKKANKCGTVQIS